MVEIVKTNEHVILKYSSDFANPNWLASRLGLYDAEVHGEAVIAHTFHVTKDLYIKSKIDIDNIKNNDEIINIELENKEEYLFIIAKRDGLYYLFDKNVLNINFNLYIHESIKLNRKFFIQYKNISVFRKINEIYSDGKLYIGGPDATITEEGFGDLLSRFPNSYEVYKYINARISYILRNEIGTIPDYVRKYEEYINKKDKSLKNADAIEENMVIENDVAKFELYIEKLKRMLEEYVGYPEEDWQREIVKIFQLINPKYIQIIEKMHIKDHFSGKNRYIDIVLINTSGYIDIVEIKKPQPSSLLYQGLYRNNFVPIRELQGAIMQVENYILSIIKMGSGGEKKLNEKYFNFNKELQVKIINPKGVIIMGIEQEMNDKQKNDFEIVKRMYSNVIDIITYDDLLKRLEIIYSALKNKLC